ncbi:uncharacterized protein [Canis lupus baileyi]|uniref:uncharacterized protein isoform X4 n=1 Tax=Canis lupus baileyi TaxID=143281 RepID=UPI003B978B99
MGILYNLKLLQPREPLASHHPDQSATTNIQQGNHVLKCGRSLQRFYFIREVIDLQHATQTPIAGVQRAHGPRDPFQVYNTVDSTSSSCAFYSRDLFIGGQ